MLPLREQDIRFIIVHCSATKPQLDIGAEEIRRWHKARGWEDIGYHFVIRRDGTIEPGRPLDKQGAHVAGHNHYSWGICMVGGVDENNTPAANFTGAQWESLETLVRLLLARCPQAALRGHRDFTDKKACPSFDVQSWWAGRQH